MGPQPRWKLPAVRGVAPKGDWQCQGCRLQGRGPEAPAVGRQAETTRSVVLGGSKGHLATGVALRRGIDTQTVDATWMHSKRKARPGIG